MCALYVCVRGEVWTLYPILKYVNRQGACENSGVCVLNLREGAVSVRACVYSSVNGPACLISWRNNVDNAW